MRGTIPGPDGEHDEDFPEPPRLRVLRLLVTGMLVVMMLGVIVNAGTIAWPLGGDGGALSPVEPVTAEALTLPAGLTVTAIGADGPHLLVLGRDGDGETLITLRKSDGAELSRVPVRRTE